MSHRTFAVAVSLLALTHLGCPKQPPLNGVDCSIDDCESCELLAQRFHWGTTDLKHCTHCQGQSYGTADCETVPTRAGKYVMRGCNTDSECGDLSPFCSRYASGPHFTCVLNDPR